MIQNTKGEECRAVRCEDIIIEVITEDEVVLIVEFLMKYFFPDDPYYSGCGVECTDTLKDRLTPHYQSLLKQGLSIKAVHPDTREILGVRINGNHESHDIAECFYEDDNLSEDIQRSLQHTKQVLQYEAMLRDTTVVGDKYSGTLNSQIFYFHAIATSTNARRKGIGTKLIEHSLELAKRFGYRIVRGFVSSDYSRRIYEKLGFQVLRCVKFIDCEVNGEKLLVNDTGIHHQAFTFYIKSL